MAEANEVSFYTEQAHAILKRDPSPEALQKALALYKKAIAENPLAAAESYITIAYLALKAGYTVEAQQVIQEGLRADPLNATLKQLLRLSYRAASASQPAAAIPQIRRLQP